MLVVTKLDRLGRNAIDVRQTVEQLAGRGVRVHCLALGGVDLTAPAAKMTMQVIAAVAEFERDLLVERTQVGLARAKGEGKTLGRPARLTAAPSTPAHPAFAEDLRSAAKIVNQRSVGTNARNSDSWPRLNASCKSR